MLKINGESEDTFRLEEAAPGNRNAANLTNTDGSLLHLFGQGLLQILYIKFGVSYIEYVYNVCIQPEYRRSTEHTRTHVYTCSLTQL